MGKGDKKTKQGKISMGSYGVKRKRKKASAPITVKAKPKVVVETAEETPKKAPVKKTAPKAKAAAKTTKKTEKEAEA